MRKLQNFLILYNTIHLWLTQSMVSMFTIVKQQGGNWALKNSSLKWRFSWFVFTPVVLTCSDTPVAGRVSLLQVIQKGAVKSLPSFPLCREGLTTYQLRPNLRTDSSKWTWSDITLSYGVERPLMKPLIGLLSHS